MSRVLQTNPCDTCRGGCQLPRKKFGDDCDLYIADNKHNTWVDRMLNRFYWRYKTSKKVC